MTLIITIARACSRPAPEGSALTQDCAPNRALLNISQNKGDSNPELDAYVELFLASRCPTHHHAPRYIQKVHPAKSLPLTDRIDAIIAGEAEKMQNALQELQVRFAVHTAHGVDATKTHAKRLAEQLGVGETSDPQSAVISVLQTLSRSLLVIDNLETLWFSNNAAAQKTTERFLQRLADVPSLTLIVTSRGSVTPSGIEWTNDQSAELEAISLDAARETFEQIAGRPQVTTECDALDKLLAGVDCMPLAVTLLAQLARRKKNSPSQLLQRWHHSKTTFIHTGGDHRESSVNVSIQISLDLLSAMTGGTEGGRLLSICAHLPDGLRTPVFAQLVTQFSDI
ncbi:hypothetical protein BKA62DRAFT_780494 [Auriculariales sp. MPI-PUGE-AT-0066]|nr:hypothetical protein BKA62DRAFT_780494 [Auriculariales sp. MPI-PUGE-AT-0066]